MLYLEYEHVMESITDKKSIYMYIETWNSYMYSGTSIIQISIIRTLDYPNTHIICSIRVFTNFVTWPNFYDYNTTLVFKGLCSSKQKIVSPKAKHFDILL